MVTVRASGLGVSSASIAHTCPAYGEASRLGQCTSASGMCGADAPAEGGADAAFAAPPRLPAGVDLACLEPQPRGEDGADACQPSQCGPGGRVGQGGGFHPGRGQPAPGRARSKRAGLGITGKPRWADLGDLATIQVRVLMYQAGVIIEVWDRDPMMPVRHDATSDEEGGRGLTIVTALCTRGITSPQAVAARWCGPNWRSRPAY